MEKLPPVSYTHCLGRLDFLFQGLAHFEKLARMSPGFGTSFALTQKREGHKVQRKEKAMKTKTSVKAGYVVH
jgi:hypothetical protein